MLKTETCKTSNMRVHFTTTCQISFSTDTCSSLTCDATHWIGQAAWSLSYCIFFAISWSRRQMKILQHSWMLCCPRNIKLEEAVLEGPLCTYNIALPFSSAWNTGQVPPPWQWIYSRGLLTWCIADRIFAARKLSSNEVTTLFSTHFSYAKSSFPPLQRVGFLPAVQPHAAAMQKWNYYWMEEVGDLWEVFLWKNNNPIKKTSDGCVVKDIPKLSVLWLLLATTFGS